MAISDFYVSNSTARHFHTNDLDFDFKTFNTPFNQITDMSDLSFGISTNEHAFYNDYTYGITDTKTKYNNAGIAENNYNDSADFVTTGIASTYALVYFPDEHSKPYIDENLSDFEYVNFTTGNTNINQLCYLVTDFTFDNIILHGKCVPSEIWELYYDKSNEGYKPLYNFGASDDVAKLCNNFVIDLHYWSGNNSVSLSNNFALFNIVSLNNNIIAYKITNNSIISTLVTPETAQGTETTDFLGVPKFNTNLKTKAIDGLAFNHCINTENIYAEGDKIYKQPSNRSELGNVIIPRWTGLFQMYYCNLIRKDYAIDLMSATGLRFMYVDNTYGVSPQTYNDEISIAYMDSDGIVDWTNIIKGLNNINNSDSHNKNIDYSTLPDIDYKKEKTDDKDHINPVDYRFTNEIGGFTRYYKVSRSQLAQIVSTINTAADLPDGYEFLPHIVSVRQYPFNTSQYAAGHAENIVIGGYDTGVTGLNLDSTQMAIQTIAEITVPSKYKSFLDKSPYTQLSLYIPCCNWVDLPDIVVGRTITVELAHDIINGGCIGIVKLEGMPIVQASGKMGTDISISAVENGLKQAALTQAAFNVGGGVLSTGFALATGNAVGVFSGIMSTASALSQGNIANNSNYTHQIGNTGDKSNDHISNKCYLRVSFPIADIPKNFAHTYGFICNQTHKLSECSGFTICDKVDLSGITATDNEKTRLKQILETGFYC